MIIILFGLAASGKNYVGKTLSDNFDFYYQDADQWLTEEMQEYIKDGKLFTFEMLASFSEILINNINKLNQVHPNLIISQALYRQENRNQIEKSFSKKSLLFIQIEASDELIYKRIIDRGGDVTPSYADSMHQFFESQKNALSIENNIDGSDHIIKQFKDVIKRFL